MKIDPLAVTYSRALVELASGAGRLLDVLDQLRSLKALLGENRDLRSFIETPGIGRGEKRRVFDAAFRGRFDDVVVDFLELLIEKGRQLLLPEILEACEILYDEVAGRVRVRVDSVVPLEGALRDELVRVLAARLGKTIILEDRVDPDLIGGLVLRYGDMVADGSVRTALENIGRRLEEARIGSELVQ